MPDPPTPIHDPNFLSLLASLTVPVWQSAGITDPNGVALGHIIDRNGVHAHVCPVRDSGASSKWTLRSSVGSGVYGLLLTQADANKILASGTTINGSGQLVISSGSTYNGQQYHHSETLIVYRLA